MPNMGSDDAALRLLDDAGVKGGSPVDRIIGMLLERTEAVRELHDSMRQEFRAMIDTHADVRAALARLSDRMDSHEKSDTMAFSAVNAAILANSAELAALRKTIEAATTAAVIQKAQVNAGWKVITVIGAIVLAAISIFAIFYNHKP